HDTPNFVANRVGIAGMLASMRLLLDIGIDAIGQRLLELRGALVDRLRPLGYQPLLDADTPDADRHLSGIVSVSHPTRDLAAIVRELDAGGVSVSLRHNRLGQAFIRFSPHFYNTDEEIDRAIALMQS
ncbi:MAG TPA: aminotransferase class V-fold PLP-dependent enzyme, partial [Candidatus Hydrogenedentes bacterium]|nr:aminotransferase class V-fold PLP-dependent enzyme [Candidatus Hydrogenedentota bacterium]